MTDVNDSSKLEQNLKRLTDVMSELNSRPVELGMEKWVKDLQRNQVEVNEINDKLVEVNKMRIQGGVRINLNKRVLKCLEVANTLKTRADEIHDSVQIFMSNIATWKTAKFSAADINRYITKPVTKIGSGEFGDVYKAKLPNDVEGAVKILKCTEMREAEKTFVAEVSTMSKTYHRNLARLYGYCFDHGMIALVYEYFERGSLEDILDGSHRRVDWSILYGIAIGTARGLSYLHEHCNDRIIHRDIKAGNILLDAKYVPKITDFGLAKLYSTDKSKASTTMFKRSHGYDSPEVRLGRDPGRDLTYKSDVFSFGMLLLDIVRRKTSEDDMKTFAINVWDKYNNQQLDHIMEECNIREKDKESAKELSIVALCCIQDFPVDRPSMSTVLKVLEGDMQLPPPKYPFGISGRPSS